MTAHTNHPDAPADTQMMPIVHSALRRDLVRLRIVLGTPEAAEPRRRTALAEHVLWLMHFLHDHHSGEDDGLYPLVVRRNPERRSRWSRWTRTTAPSRRQWTI